jgi:hypothetical protein
VTRSRTWLALVVAGVLLAGACSKGPAKSAAPSASSVPPSPSASPSASASVTPSPTVSATPSPTPTPKPTPPKPTTPPGKPLTANGAYLETSEDENLTDPDPENGCEVHDPDLDEVRCGVVAMAGGTATWITGRERHNLPGADEPRIVVRLYRRLANGTDSMVYVGLGEPGQWAEAEVRVGSLTGQVRDALVVVVTFRGSGTQAGYDVVTWRAGSPMTLRAHHAEGSHAQIFVRSRGYVSTYEADYSDGAPNCCPNAWTHDNVYWDGSLFRLRKFANVSSPPSA